MDSNRIYVKDSIVRWQSSDNIPFDDMLAKFVVEGKITQSEAVKSAEQRKVETTRALENYYKRNKGRELSDEERFEMRAAFGEGAEVTNIITGDTYKV